MPSCGLSRSGSSTVSTDISGSEVFSSVNNSVCRNVSELETLEGFPLSVEWFLNAVLRDWGADWQ